MAGKGTPDLRLPLRRYDPRGRAGFETRAEAARQDAIRAHLLRRTARGHPELATRLRDLADLLDPALISTPITPASSRRMRWYRRRLVGALWRLYDEA